MSDRVHRLHLTGEQMFAERVHVNLRSPVVIRSTRTQRVIFLVLGLVVGVLAGLLGVATSMVGGSPGSVAPLVVLGLVCVAIGLAMPAYYRAVIPFIERRVWAYLGEDGAVVHLSADGVALDAGPRSVRTGWRYFDDAAALPEGLELRRRGGPVAFYPAAAFGSSEAVAAASDDVRSWIWASGGRPSAG